MRLNIARITGFAVAISLLGAVAPAFANTQGIRGVNWADARNNFQTGWVLPSGMYAGMSNSAAYALGQQVALACKSIHGTYVRMPVNPPTVSSSGNNWSNYQQAINGVLSEGVGVDLCYWTENGGGTIYNTTTWGQMWSTINSTYGSNSMVLFEPINEPYGYSASSLVAIYLSFLSTYHVSNWKCLFDGTDYAQYLSGVATDSALDNQYFAVHIYQNWDNVANNEDWQDYITALDTAVDGYESQTVVTEMGADSTDGSNYYGQDADGLAAEIEYIIGSCNFVYNNSMGSFNWAGVKDSDSYRMFDSSSDISSGNYSVENSTLAEEFYWSWHQ